MREDEVWQAITTNDAQYDGQVFYAVQTTGIFCRPSCKSKPPRRENVAFFPSAAAAQGAGFRPCKRCRPELLAYAPQQELATAIRQQLSLHYSQTTVLAQTARQLGISLSYLRQLFTQSYGEPPLTYLRRLRLQFAARELRNGEQAVLDIALAAGYQSVSAFYAAFKREWRMSPAAYRAIMKQTDARPREDGG